jgi:hypothetical protein
MKLSKNIKLSENIRKKILIGLELSYKKLVKDKKDKNLNLIISENGKIIEINPNDFSKYLN